MKSLNILIPAMLMLPTFTPSLSHLFSRTFLDCLILADPLVRFLFIFYFPFVPLCALVGTLVGLFLASSFIIYILVALAHGGASPMPTPAELMLGGLLTMVEVVTSLWWWWKWSEGCVSTLFRLH
jgi:hypothetical protein